MLRVLTRTLALPLLALALCACSDASSAREAEREAELKSLKERVERLEREQTSERQKLGQDVEALRGALDEANQRMANQGMAALDGKPAQADQPGLPGKSPRAALKQSLSEVMESARQALERLNHSLDQSLSRPKAREQEPAK